MENIKKIKLRLMIFVLLSIPVLLMLSYYFMKENTKDFIIKNTVEQARKVALELIVTRDHIATISPYIELKSDRLHPFAFTPAHIGANIGRELSEKTGFYIKQTSIKYRNVVNTPDIIETDILKKLKDNNLDEYWEISKYDGKDAIRYGKSMYIKKDCLTCHGDINKDVPKHLYEKIVAIYGDRAFGYKIGEQRGMVSVAIPLDIANKQLDSFYIHIVITIIAIMVFIMVFMFIEYKFVFFPQLHEIEKSQNKLKTLNSSLEEKVDKRTKELSHALEEVEVQKSELEKNIQTLNQTQKKLVLSEKMASLGQLIAGVTHEINTPLGAIKSSSQILNSSIKETMIDIPEAISSFSKDEKELFFKLLDESSNLQVPISTKEQREYKKSIQKVLEENDIEDARAIANYFVKVGIHNIDKYKDYIKCNNLEYILSEALKLSDIIKNSSNIQTATDKISKIVFALKSFSRLDQNENMKEIYIKDSIETVLTLYHNQIKHSVELLTDFKDIEPIYCYSDQIAQVWTNIIHNALQAMDSDGKLIVSTTEDETYQIIKIKDNGNGIPEEIQDKIYEPFFTTKGTGEGSGLGLDIIKRVVENHNGKVEFTSVVGEGTEFRVYLPKNQNI
jgi:signal transduction histidine kinase